MFYECLFEQFSCMLISGTVGAGDGVYYTSVGATVIYEDFKGVLLRFLPHDFVRLYGYYGL